MGDAKNNDLRVGWANATGDCSLMAANVLTIQRDDRQVCVFEPCVFDVPWCNRDTQEFSDAPRGEVPGSYDPWQEVRTVST